MDKKIAQTAGRNALGEFAPEFAHYNDDVLFGENWNNQDIDVKTRSIITVVALMSSGITDSSLKYHLQNANRCREYRSCSHKYGCRDLGKGIVQSGNGSTSYIVGKNANQWKGVRYSPVKRTESRSQIGYGFLRNISICIIR